MHRFELDEEDAVRDFDEEGDCGNYEQKAGISTFFGANDVAKLCGNCTAWIVAGEQKPDEDEEDDDPRLVKVTVKRLPDDLKFTTITYPSTGDTKVIAQLCNVAMHELGLAPFTAEIAVELEGLLVLVRG